MLYVKSWPRILQLLVASTIFAVFEFVPAQSYLLPNTKRMSYVDFMKQLRAAISEQGVDVNAYGADIKTISDLLSKCPANMPVAQRSNDPRATGCEAFGPNFVQYCNSELRRVCQVGYPIALPLSSQSRRLYLRANDTTDILPETHKVSYLISISIDSADRSRRQLLIEALVLPAAEVDAANARVAESIRKKQAADAAAREVAQREAEFDRLASSAPPNVKLVCLSVDDFIIKYGKTMRLSLNTENKIVWDSAGERFMYQATDTAFIWGESGQNFPLRFNLDRTTLRLQVVGLGAAVYQCRKDEPQL